jgi:hypothetical protein
MVKNPNRAYAGGKLWEHEVDGPMVSCPKCEAAKEREKGLVEAAEFLLATWRRCYDDRNTQGPMAQAVEVIEVALTEHRKAMGEG